MNKKQLPVGSIDNAKKTKYAKEYTDPLTGHFRVPGIMMTGGIVSTMAGILANDKKQQKP